MIIDIYPSLNLQSRYPRGEGYPDWRFKKGESGGIRRGVWQKMLKRPVCLEKLVLPMGGWLALGWGWVVGVRLGWNWGLVGLRWVWFCGWGWPISYLGLQANPTTNPNPTQPNPMSGMQWKNPPGLSSVRPWYPQSTPKPVTQQLPNHPPSSCEHLRSI